MKRAIVLIMVTALGLPVGDASARREIRTAAQKAALARAQTLYVEVLALTEQGAADPAPLRDIVTRRLTEIGLTVVADPDVPHDLAFRVKCEESKTWEGTLASGGDADLPDSPSRVWKGPACQFSYAMKGRKSDWRKEVRTSFPDARRAAAEANAADAGAFALEKLRARLEEYDFPVRLVADWGQEDRLLRILDEPGTDKARKTLIISLLGDLLSAKAASRLVQALRDPDPSVARAAAIALGEIGHKESIAALVALLRTGQPNLRIAAARALGKLGALHGDQSVVDPLLAALDTQDIALKTEVVWALGKIPDKRALVPLRRLQESLRNARTSERSSPEGKLWDAVSYSLKQIDYGDQIN